MGGADGQVRSAHVAVSPWLLGAARILTTTEMEAAHGDSTD
jgi:hypothetical protein